MSLRVWYKLNLVYQISTRLCKLDRVYKALLITKNTQNKRQKAFPAKNIIQINNIYLLLGSKKLSIFLRACTQVCIIFADTSGLFNGDRLINVLNFTSPSKIQISGNRTDFKTEIQKHIPYKESEKIHQVHVITCFNRLNCSCVKIMFQKMSQHQQNNSA